MTPTQLIKQRQRLGYSIEELAGLLGVNFSTYWRWEAGKSQIPPFLHLALKSIPVKASA